MCGVHLQQLRAAGVVVGEGIDILASPENRAFDVGALHPNVTKWNLDVCSSPCGILAD